MSNKKLFLLDAMALVFRAYYALIRSPRITSYGKNTNAQFGFVNALLDIIKKEQPTHLAVVFDNDAPTERHTDFEGYKANRQEAPEDLRAAIPEIKELVKAFNLPCLELDGYEADDLIGTLAWQAADQGFDVFMVTPDKDYGQLVKHNVHIYKPGYQGGSVEILGEKEVCEKWQIQRVDQVVDLLGLMGDAVDNIPGIAGVGEKTAAKLLAQYDTLENVLANADDIKGALGEKVRKGKDNAILSKKLATIITNAPMTFDDEQFTIGKPNEAAVMDIFQRLEFRTLAKRVFGEELKPNETNTITKGTGNLSQPDLFSSAEAYESNFKTIKDVDHQYFLIQGEKVIQELIDQINHQTKVAFDTETTGIDPNLAQLVGMSFSWEVGRAFYVPVPEDIEEAKNLLKQFDSVFNNEKIEWIGQNIKYDLLILKWYGVEPKGTYYDTMLAHYVVDADAKHNMDAMANQLLDYQPVSIESLIGKKGKNQKSMRDVALEEIKEYAAEDADITLQLAHKIAPLVEKEEVTEVLHKIELPLLPILRDMEYEGIALDVPFLTDYAKELDHEIKIIEQQVYQWAGSSFNLASPKQLGEVLFDKMKLDPSAKKTKTGQYATGEDVLAKLRHQHEIVDAILSYRELTKLKSTYVDALPQLIHPKTGRIHTSYNQAVAVTGRLSSNNPNLQNIPIRTDRGREIRKAFIASEEDKILISADYSQIELRIIAAISGDENMIQAFVDDKDIHTATAARVYGVPENEVDKNMRRNAKAVNFGIIYGQSAFGLAENLGISRSEARTIIDSYFEQYAGIKKYMEKYKLKAQQTGYAQTILGRRRYLKDINSSNHTVRGFAERNAINMPIQGSAADMIKLAMINVDQILKSHRMATKMLLQVHDELVFEAPKEESEEVIVLIKKAMEQAMPLPNGVPVKAEAGMGDNWLVAH